MPRFAGYALSLSLCFAGSTAFAQGALTDLYGEGVHRYFAGDLLTAEQLLTRVIDSGQEDPRAYYFRGLTREYLGSGGQEDFETGARIEAEGGRSYDISFALSRIQGLTRAQIERIRLDARVVAQQQAMEQERSRIESGGTPPPPRAEFDPNVVPPADLAPPALPPVDDSDPFSEPSPATPPIVDPVQPTAPDVDALSDPFADDPTPAPATTPDAPPADAADPFSPDAAPPAVDDPFGTEPTPDAAPPAVDDPFAEPATGEPAPAEPDMEAEDPFQ